jgi:hypothetical protein
MSAGPSIRRKDKSLRVGAITLDQRHRAKNGEIFAVAEKLSALRTASYFAERAARPNRHNPIGPAIHCRLQHLARPASMIACDSVKKQQQVGWVKRS